MKTCAQAMVTKLVMVLTMTPSLTWVAAIPVYAQGDDKPFNKYEMPQTLKEHPVLHVKPFEPALVKPNSVVFKKLNGMLKTPGMTKDADYSYQNAEFTVVQEFCNQAQGLTPLAVEKLANEPFLKGGDSPCKPHKIDGDEDWLYIFGTTPILARLVFKNGVCNESWANFYYRDPWYVGWHKNWKERQFNQSLVGKTIAEIIDAEGKPCHSNPPVNTTGITPEQLSDFWKNLKIQQIDLDYQTGSNTFSTLRFKDGICVEACKSIRTGQQDHSGISFKMPPRE